MVKAHEVMEVTVKWVKWGQSYLKIGELSSKAKYGVLSDSEEYREGKLKRI